MTQKHHITYKPKEWKVGLTGWEHKAVTHLQNLKPTKKNLEHASDLLHAVSHEWNRLAYQLYQIENKNINPIKKTGSATE
jgi:hypothetical protein